MGIPIAGPTYMFGDNQSVILSSTVPESTLRKQNVAMSYHAVCAAIAAGIVMFFHIKSEDNPSDILTKFLPNHKWWPLLKPLLHWNTDTQDN